MAKSPLEKQLEKQQKAQEKAAREARLRDEASAIVSAHPIVNGFQEMDEDSETVLQSILEQYDGNENNNINYNYGVLKPSLQRGIFLQYEKLKMYGMISDTLYFGGGAMITISDQAKNYFDKKHETATSRASTVNKPTKSNTKSHKKYDVFISHASADKENYVDLLNASVKRLGINVFYDSDVLSWGDNWKQVILDGTAESEFAVIVISKKFFGREWTEKELHKFLSQQNESGQKIVLPLLYNITLDELKAHYPELGDIQCISADRYSKEEVTILLAKELIKRYK